MRGYLNITTTNIVDRPIWYYVRISMGKYPGTEIDMDLSTELSRPATRCKDRLSEHCRILYPI